MPNSSNPGPTAANPAPSGGGVAPRPGYFDSPASQNPGAFLPQIPGATTQPSNPYAALGIQSPAVAAGPYASGYINPAQAQVLTQYQQATGNPFDMSLLNNYNAAKGFFDAYNQPQVDYLAQQADFLKRQGAIQFQNQQAQGGFLNDAYGIDMAKLGLQGQQLSHAAGSIQANMASAQRLADLARAGIIDSQQLATALYNQFTGQAQGDLGRIGESEVSARTAKDLTDRQAKIQEDAQQRAILDAAISAGAGLSGGTNNSLTDLHNVAALAGQQRNLSLEDVLRGFAGQRSDIQGALDKGKLNYEAGQRDFGRQLSAQKEQTAQTMRGFNDQLFSNSLARMGLQLQGKELKLALDRGLQNLGYSSQMSTLDLQRALASNNYQERALAEQVVQQALQAAMGWGGAAPAPAVAGSSKSGAHKTTSAATGGGVGQMKVV